MKRFIFLFFALCILALLAFLPIPVPPYLDFQVIYHADLGLLRGISIYDHAGQVNMIAELAHVLPEQAYVLPFPYPPWYALATLPLALLPITIAARLWFGLNLLMLCASVWLLTEGWEPRKRLAAFPTTLFFWPILGSLFIGQYNFPILLGAALFAYSLRNQRVGLAALAAALLTFKPHLGLLILLTGLLYLFLRRDEFGRRALMSITVTGIFLFAVGFLASPLWPLDYLHSLTGFKEVSQCHLCNNVSMMLAGLLNGGLDLAIWFAAGLFILAIGWVIFQRRVLMKQPDLLIASLAVITLLVSPYLQNYDYILLLVPLYFLAGRAKKLDWLFLICAYILPFLGLGIFGTAGEILLDASALILFALMASAAHQLKEPRNVLAGTT
jgi:hypothetical protein